MTTKFIGIREFRGNMAKISNEARRKKQRLIILRKNCPLFELRPLSKDETDLESLLSSIQEGEADVRAGRSISQKTLEKRLGL